MSLAKQSMPFYQTMILAALLVAMIAALALEEKLHAKKSVIVGVFAILTLFIADAWSLLPVGHVINVFGEKMKLPVYIPAIDWGVMGMELFGGLDFENPAFRRFAITGRADARSVRASRHEARSGPHAGGGRRARSCSPRRCCSAPAPR